MADTKISDLTAAGTLTGTEMVEVAVVGSPNLSRRTTTQAIADLSGTIQAKTHAATSKTTPVDADEIPLVDSAASFGLKKLLFSVLKAIIKAPVVQAVTSAGTVTPAFGEDLIKITAQAAALALANPSGTSIPGWGFVIRIKDNGTARAISYGTQYRAIGVTLPTTTVISKTVYLACIWNSDDTKLDVIAVGQEA